MGDDSILKKTNNKVKLGVLRSILHSVIIPPA